MLQLKQRFYREPPMSVKEQLKSEIDHLDEHYLELLFNIVRQFPHTVEEGRSGKKAAELFRELAEEGGLGIPDGKAWQQEVRRDRPQVEIDGRVKLERPTTEHLQAAVKR